MAIELSGGTLATYANTAPSDSFTVASGRIDDDPSAARNGVGQLRGDAGTFTYSLNGAGISQITANGVLVGYQLSGLFGTLTLATDGRYQYVPNSASIKASAGSSTADTFQITARADTGVQTTQTAFTVAITGTGASAVTLSGGQLAAYADTSANDTFALATGMFDTDRTAASNGVGNLAGGSGAASYALIGAGVSRITSGGTVVGTQLTDAYGTLTVASDGRYQFEPNQRALNALPAGTTSASYAIEATDANGTTALATYTIALTGAASAPTLSAGTLATYASTAPAGSFAVASGRIDSDPTDAQNGVGQLRGDTGTFTYALSGAGNSQITADGVLVGYQLSGAYGTLTLATDGRYQYVPDAAAIKASAGSAAADTFQITVLAGNGLRTVQTGFTVAINGTSASSTTLTGGQLAVYADTSADDTFAVATGMFDTDRSAASNGVGNLAGGSGAASYVLTGAGVSTITSSGTVIGTQLTDTYGTLTVATDGRYQFEPNQRTLNALPTGTTTLPFTLEVGNGNGTAVTATYTIALTGGATVPTLSSGVLATYASTAPADSFAVASGRIDDDPTAAQNGVGQLRGDAGSFTYALNGAGTSRITANGVLVGYQLSGAYGTLTLATDGRYQYVPDGAAITKAGNSAADTFQITAATSGLSTTQTAFTVAITGAATSAATLAVSRLAADVDVTRAVASDAILHGGAGDHRADGNGDLDILANGSDQHPATRNAFASPFARSDGPDSHVAIGAVAFHSTDVAVVSAESPFPAG